MPAKMTLFDCILLCLAAGLFGSAFVFVNMAVADLPPLTVTAGRLAIAMVFVVILAMFRRVSVPPPGRIWLSFLVLGLLSGAIPFSAIAFSQQHITSGMAGILYATIPLQTIILAQYLTKDEPLTWGKAIGVAVGMAGVVVIVGPMVFADIGDQMLGAGVVLVGALSHSLGGIYARRLGMFAPVLLAAAQLVWATIVIVPLAWIVDGPAPLPPSAYMGLAVLTGGAALCGGLKISLFGREGVRRLFRPGRHKVSK